MMRRLAGIVTGLGLVFLLALTASAHHKPWHPIPPGHQDTTTTSTAVSSSTTTTLPPSTTTTVPTQTTTTVPPSTTTTAPPATTTTSASTTTTSSPSQTINLTADWHITSDDVRSGFSVEANGHQIIIDGADVAWTDFSINNASRIMWHGECGVASLTNGLVTNAGITGELGFYPLHFHLCGEATRGSIVQNVTVENGQNHAFVPHGSNGISFLDTAALNTIDSPYWWDPPGTNEDCFRQKFCTIDNSSDIVIDQGFVNGVTSPPGSTNVRLTGFVLGAGSGNVIRNSHGENIAGRVDCSAFHWPEHANQNVGGNVWVFENNTGSSACHGIMVWQNDSNLHIVDGFSGGGIDHGAYGNNYDYRNVDVPYVEVHAVGWVLSNSDVGEIILRPHRFSGSVTFTNITSTGITVVDAPAGGTNQPITFNVDSSNLTCGDVDFANPHPDTRVLLDGVEC